MSVTHMTTIEQLWEMPEKPGVRYELADGELIEVSAAGVVHGLIVKLLLRLLDDFAVQHSLGIVLGDGVGFVLETAPPTLRIPDVSFVSHERTDQVGIPEGFWPTAPDLAVEVVSPHDRTDDVHAKVNEYLAAGTQTVWVLWPREQMVAVHGHGEPVRRLDASERLDGGAVLPGFSVHLAELFKI